jgi:hypothetical protein
LLEGDSVRALKLVRGAADAATGSKTPPKSEAATDSVVTRALPTASSAPPVKLLMQGLSGDYCLLRSNHNQLSQNRPATIATAPVAAGRPAC